jgi:hypothetical protein
VRLLLPRRSSSGELVSPSSSPDFLNDRELAAPLATFSLSFSTASG